MNILDSISFCHRLFQFCNLSQLQFEKMTWSTARSRFLDLYSYAVLLLSIVVLLQGIFIRNWNGLSSSDIGVTVDFIQLISIRLAHIICIIETLCYRNEQQKLIQKIQEIDKIFEISLNTDVENRRLRLKNIRNGLAMLGVYVASEFFILFITALGPNAYLTFFWILYMVPLLICGMRYFQYITFVGIIKQRFEKLTLALKSVNLLQTNKFEKQRFSGRIPVKVKSIKNMETLNRYTYQDGSDLTNLLVIRDLYNSLYEVSVLVNRCFGLSVLVIIGVDFLAMTSNFYWMFLNFQKYSSSYVDFFRTLSSVFWSVPHIFNITALVIVCHKTIETTSEIALDVHRIQVDLLNDNHNSLIEQFSLQLLHQKVQFSALGFFTIDCGLLYTIVGATTTYLIILIQFHLSEQKEVSTKTLQTAILNLTQ